MILISFLAFLLLIGKLNENKKKEKKQVESFNCGCIPSINSYSFNPYGASTFYFVIIACKFQLFPFEMI
jgi:hypothetical protein